MTHAIVSAKDNCRYCALGVLCLVAALTAGAGGAKAQAVGAPPAPASASGSTVPTKDKPATQPSGTMNSASCLIEPKQLVKLASPIQGTIKDVAVSRGQTVKAGDVVVRLESEVEQAQLLAAKLRAETDALVKSKIAELDAASKKLTRSRQLGDVVSRQKLEEAETAADLARLALEQAKYEQQAAIIDVQRLTATIERRMIRSPVNGLVTKVDLHAGEYADPQVPILYIAEVRPLLVEIYLPAELYLRMRIGMRMEIRPRSPIGGRYTTEIATKDSHIDSASGTFQITALLPNQDGVIPSGIRCDASPID